MILTKPQEIEVNNIDVDNQDCPIDPQERLQCDSCQ